MNNTRQAEIRVFNSVTGSKWAFIGLSSINLRVTS
jgi:hypothetical protein